MGEIVARAVLMLSMLLVAPAHALAQGPGRSPDCAGDCGPQAGGGPGAMRRGGRMGPGGGFDPSSVTTVQGDIVEVEHGPGWRAQGVHLRLAVGTETLDVHLAPSAYLEEQGLQLNKGERVEVKGSRITRRGTPSLIAQEIRTGERTVTLRDASGVPLWAGRRGGRR